MKKIVFMLTALCLTTVGAYAQLTGGLKAGVNLTTQKWAAGDEDEKYSGTGFHFGAYANFALSDAMSVQPELLYNSLKISEDDDDITMNYLSIPVMFMYGFSENKFNIQAGPQIGFLLSTDPSEFKDEDGLTGTDFGLNIGAGANFGKLNVTARYCIGIGNVAGSAFTDDIDDFSIKNSAIQISLGYSLFGGE
jgi:hypothetical protein